MNIATLAEVYRSIRMTEKVYNENDCNRRRYRPPAEFENSVSSRVNPQLLEKVRVSECFLRHD